MARYRVLATSFINGMLIDPNMGDASIVELPEGVEPGRNLELVDEKELEAAKESALDGQGYSVRSNGGGRYIVIDKDGNQIGTVFQKSDVAGQAKADAQAEADRLNGVLVADVQPAGHDQDVPKEEQDAALPTVQQPLLEPAASEGNLPDA